MACARQLMPRHSKGHTRLACKPSELEARRGQLEQEGRHFIPADVLPMHQSSTGRTYTGDAYAPVCRDAHAEVQKLTACSIPGAFRRLLQTHFCYPGNQGRGLNTEKLCGSIGAFDFPASLLKNRKKVFALAASDLRLCQIFGFRLVHIHSIKRSWIRFVPRKMEIRAPPQRK